MLSKEVRLLPELFFIVNKDGKKVPFVPNEVQAHYDERKSNRDIIVKARQFGFSSYIDAYIALKCLAEENIRAVLIAHDRESTEKLFDRVRFFLNNPKLPLKPDLTRSSRREFYFRKNNSSFFIGTAGSEDFGRGDTINYLHGSEVASWPDPQKLTAGLFEAVPRNGNIWLESTAQGAGTWFHLRALRAREKQSRFSMHFYPWFMFNEYSLPENQWPRYWPGKEEIFDKRELELMSVHGLNRNQLAWRFEKMKEMDDSDLANGSNLFCQEYPSTFEEAFITSGASVFKYISICEVEGRTVNELTTFREPERGEDYIIGVDVGAGVGRDRSVIWGLACNKFEQAFEWVSDQVDPDELAGVIADLAKKYNKAWVNPEINNHGIATVAALRRVHSAAKIFQRYSYDKRESIERLGRLGWLTTEKSKGQMISNLRKGLRDGLKVYSVSSRNELSTYVELKPGHFGAQSGTYDDRVIAMALAVTAYRHLHQSVIEEEVQYPNEMSFAYQRKLYIDRFVHENGFTPGHQHVDTGYIN